MIPTCCDREVQALQQRLAGTMRRGDPLPEKAARVCGAPHGVGNGCLRVRGSGLEKSAERQDNMGSCY